MMKDGVKEVDVILIGQHRDSSDGETFSILTVEVET
jgi:hypothetical protein